VTVHELITAALQDLQELESGETANADDAATGLARLNDWIDSNANENLLVYTLTRTSWALGSAPFYTVGLQGTLNMQRPASPSDISSIGYYDTSLSTPYQDVQVSLYTDLEYQAIAQKALTSTYPQAFHYNATFGTDGWGTLTPWPIPTSTSLRGFLYTKTVVEEFADITDEILLPKGYRRFFRTNLAIELASAFGLPVPEQVAKAARETGITIKSKNVRTEEMASPFDAQQYDINSDVIRIRR
jgi:hypothetical protein